MRTPFQRHLPLAPLGRSLLLATALTGGLVGHAMAQDLPNDEAMQQPATRASVHADLVRLEQAGYNPNAEEATYPALTQAAEARAYPPTRAQYAVADTGQGVRTYNASGTPTN